MQLYEAVLKHLPDTVIPSLDTNWDFHPNYEEVPGAIKIVQKEHDSGISFSNEFWADGVRPKGLKILAEILWEAFKDTGMDISSIKAITK